MRSIVLTLTFLAAFTLSSCKAGSPIGNPNSPVTGTVETREQLETKANAGDRDAQFQLGAMYHDGQEVEKDLKLALEWLEKSAAQGDQRAQFNLGVMHFSGDGMAQDYDKAREWFQKAAAQGNARAQFNLGVMYYRGEGVTQDPERALGLFTDAAKQGFAEAQFNLGVMYAKGEGILPDVAQAYAWFSVADAFGNERSAEILQQIENGLSPEQSDLLHDLAQQTLDEVKENIAAAAEKVKEGM